MADRFDLSYPDLQVRFGLMSRQEVWSYIESAPLTVATVPAADDNADRPPKLSELKPRLDAPPL